MADFMASVGDLGLRPALVALLAVVRENRGINQTALGRSLGIQRANLVPLVNELTTRDLVRRQPHPRDRRAFALSLTPTGEQLLAEAERRIRAHEERVLAGLTANERQTLRELLNRIRGD
jgi:DNA-binding MarR family transcriptional regulator